VPDEHDSGNPLVILLEVQDLERGFVLLLIKRDAQGQ
jgi:hypothetical protein